MNRSELASIADHTILKFNVDLLKVKAFCLEAQANNINSVNIFPSNVSVARTWLAGSKVGITAAIAFPYGGLSVNLKKFEAKDAIQNGATCCDFVVNIGAIKDRDYDAVRREMEAMREVCREATVKATLETYFLSEEEIAKTCEIAAAASIDYVKPSTGFFAASTLEHLKSVIEALRNTRTRANAFSGNQGVEQVAAMVEAGAGRIGMCNSIEILENWPED